MYSWPHTSASVSSIHARNGAAIGAGLATRRFCPCIVELRCSIYSG